MINLNKLFEIIAIAVATGAAAYFVIKWRERHNQIEHFRYHCDRRFSHSVVYNEDLPQGIREYLMAAYKKSKIPYIFLLFSSRPLNPVNWYNQEQLDEFFN